MARLGGGRLDGRVAIVTGGGRGIGVAYCKALAEHGAKVVVSDILDTENTVNIIKQAGGEAIGIPCDVTDPDAVHAMVASSIEAFGKVDIMVTNAALFADLEQKPFMEIDEAEWDRVMTVNTRGVFTCVKAVVPEMRKNGYGKIINISSGRAFKGGPGMLHYDTSKGAVIAMTRSLARELGGDGICVNAIAPGATDTAAYLAGETEEMRASRTRGLTQRALKRAETPEDLVGTCVFLASADSDFMTGQTIVVDGGNVMW